MWLSYLNERWSEAVEREKETLAYLLDIDLCGMNLKRHAHTHPHKNKSCSTLQSGPHATTIICSTGTLFDIYLMKNIYILTVNACQLFLRPIHTFHVCVATFHHLSSLRRSRRLHRRPCATQTYQCKHRLSAVLVH